VDETSVVAFLLIDLPVVKETVQKFARRSKNMFEYLKQK